VAGEAGTAGQALEPMAIDGGAAEASLDLDTTAAPRSRVEAVGTIVPDQDFEALLQHGRADEAFRQLPPVVLGLIDTSILDRCDHCPLLKYICSLLVAQSTFGIMPAKRQCTRDCPRLCLRHRIFSCSMRVVTLCMVSKKQ